MSSKAGKESEVAEFLENSFRAPRKLHLAFKVREKAIADESTRSSLRSR
jgi:hypothetical protein